MSSLAKATATPTLPAKKRKTSNTNQAPSTHQPQPQQHHPQQQEAYESKHQHILTSIPFKKRRNSSHSSSSDRPPQALEPALLETKQSYSSTSQSSSEIMQNESSTSAKQQMPPIKKRKGSRYSTTSSPSTCRRTRSQGLNSSAVNIQENGRKGSHDSSVSLNLDWSPNTSLHSTNNINKLIDPILPTTTDDSSLLPNSLDDKLLTEISPLLPAALPHSMPSFGTPTASTSSFPIQPMLVEPQKVVAEVSDQGANQQQSSSSILITKNSTSTASNYNNNNSTEEVVGLSINDNERKSSDATDNQSFESATSSSQRMLLEAMMMTTLNFVSSGPIKTNASLSSLAAASNSTATASLGPGAPTTAAAAATTIVAASNSSAVTAGGSFSHVNHPTAPSVPVTSRERLESWSVVPRDRLELWGGLLPHRERLESWGGMSDLSIPLVGGGINTDDSKLHGVKTVNIPSGIALERDRLNSVASLSEVSVNLPVAFDASVLDGLTAIGTGLGIESTGSCIGIHPNDLQAYVAAAVASVSDELVELAEAVENAASGTDYILDIAKHGPDSDSSSIASPMIGAVSDAGRKGSQSGSGGPSCESNELATGRRRSWSTGSGKLSVDYEAVQAAIDAAHEAASSLENMVTATSLLEPAPTENAAPASDSKCAKLKRRVASQRKLPITQHARSSSPTPESAIGSKKSRRAKVTDLVPKNVETRTPSLNTYSSQPSHSFKAAPPLKKRVRRTSPPEDMNQTNALASTPKRSNQNRDAKGEEMSTFDYPYVVSESVSSRASQTPSARKWELMFHALEEFAKERREIESKVLSIEEKCQWVWDGNVPTSYKTKDGKALGRWVNNQRTAKANGTLKEEREERLVAVGLKFSVQYADTWSSMFKELQLYIEDQVKCGRKWDGNVPTNYQIKARPGISLKVEDRSLGRWINRQRSMFQQGRLQKDRQIELEKTGLKWSVIQTVSWETMFEALLTYIEEQKKCRSGVWDGNVPTGYRTPDQPSRPLGRWVNRMRSAYAKNHLNKLHKEKLSAIGLKWSVHLKGNEVVMKRSESNISRSNGCGETLNTAEV